VLDALTGEGLLAGGTGVAVSGIAVGVTARGAAACTADELAICVLVGSGSSVGPGAVNAGRPGADGPLISTPWTSARKLIWVKSLPKSGPRKA
jgi:hypothetical protein